MTSSPSSAQPLSPFSPDSDAGALSGRADVAGGRGGGTVIKPTLSPAASPVIDAAMLRALELARAAGAAGEVPVGAVVLSPEGAVLAEAANAREAERDPTAHGCTLVVTLEPCTMCAGAIVLARVARLVLGAWEPRTGACGSVRDVVRDTRANHQVEVRAGLRAQESQDLLTAFFADRR